MDSSSNQIPSTTKTKLADLNVGSSEDRPINPSPIDNHVLETKDEDDDNNENDDGEAINCKAASGEKHFPNISSTRPGIKTTGALLFPPFAQIATKVALGAIVALYVLNQQHALPKQLSAIVSKTLFWPTLPITISRRIGKWTTAIDESVVLGGAPFGWLDIPTRLYEDHNVRGVINMCEEYQGPVKQYKKLGMRELRLPTTDHFEPTVEDMKTAVEFIKEHKDNNLGKVYVHCRAGHGRSAAIVYGWLMAKADDIDSLDMETLNAELCQMRDVRKHLYTQPNVNGFRSWLSFQSKRGEIYGGKEL
jgi:atypical dual specificity phosphatase